MSWKQMLDRAYSLASIDALAADAGAFAAAVAAEVAPTAATIAELEARDARFAEVLAAIDSLCPRAMKLRLEHVLADDASLAPPTRAVFAQTVTGYASQLPLLAQRARDVAARGGATAPEHVAELVVAAARDVLALRDALRAGVLELARRLAEAAVPEADRHARDPRLGELERVRWSAARRDLEATAADPARVTTAPMAARTAALPAQLDEPVAVREPTFAEMIELD